MGFLWLAFGPAWAVVSGPILLRLGRSDRRAPRPLVVAGLALWIALPSIGALRVGGRGQPGFGASIGARDLRSLRKVEATIAPGDGVLVPAAHATLAGQRPSVLPVGPTAALLPYGDRRYLFNDELGASYPLGWRDLVERACAEDPATRARFLERTTARWFMVLDRGAKDGADAARRTTFCGAPLHDYGVQQPPVRVERGLWLFRLAGR
jgi:hypothetical protein